ncbi:MAG: DUF423 domain-containing protein [Bacteroidota bacterium]
MNSSLRFVVIGAISAAIGVTAGAFGAHGLKSVLSTEMLSVYETAVRYQMYHAFGLIVAGLLPSTSAWTNRAGMLFVAGTILFSGSLYVLTLTGMKWLGAITPIGGICFILGWVCIVIGPFRERG